MMPTMLSNEVNSWNTEEQKPVHCLDWCHLQPVIAGLGICLGAAANTITSLRNADRLQVEDS